MFVRMTDNSTSSHLPRRGGQRADRNADGRRAVVDSGELGTRPRSLRTRSWMLPIVAPRGRRQGQRSCKRRRCRARDAGRRRRGVPDAWCSFLRSGPAMHQGGQSGASRLHEQELHPPHCIKRAPSTLLRYQGKRTTTRDGCRCEPQLFLAISMLRLSLVASAGSSVPIRAFCLPQLEQTAAISRL